MGIITFDIAGEVNLAPDVIGANTINIAHDASHTFTEANFTTETDPVYNDPEGDGVWKVKIKTASTSLTGTLEYDSVAVDADDESSLIGITSGLLVYDAPVGTTTAFTDDIDFDIADVGSQTFSGLLTGTITMDVAAKVNQPPTTGNQTININHASTHVFTSANFTTETTPAFSDPEGDNAEDLKITGLPANGTLLNDGNPVKINDVISFTDITAGKLTYRADRSLIDARSVTVDFVIRDDGSGLFGT